MVPLTGMRIFFTPYLYIFGTDNTTTIRPHQLWIAELWIRKFIVHILRHQTAKVNSCCLIWVLKLMHIHYLIREKFRLMAVDADPSQTPVSSANCLCEDWFPTMYEYLKTFPTVTRLLLDCFFCHKLNPWSTTFWQVLIYTMLWEPLKHFI